MEFTCEGCGVTFESSWDDDDAQAEMENVFGDLPEAQQAVVCDGCYIAIMEKAQAEGWEDHDRDAADAAIRHAKADLN